MDNATIFALATPPGLSGVAVVRISGQDAFALLKAMLSPHKVLPTKNMPSARTATRGKLFDPQNGRLLDDALILTFPAPNSYTGEDIVELHLHGGYGVYESVFNALSSYGVASKHLQSASIVRHAQAGEFTKRAVINGKLDLAQAEGIQDLIEAEDDAQQSQALALAGGALSSKIKAWHNVLLDINAHFTASIDFVDQELSDDLANAARARLAPVIDEMSHILSSAEKGKATRRGAMAAIIGAPNVGKSALLNRLSRQSVAIVSSQAGTTRDVVECRIKLNGMLLTLADTAGLHTESDDLIEIEGMRRTRAKAGEANFKINVVSLAASGAIQPFECLDAVDNFNDDRDKQDGVNRWLSEQDILVVNKCDLVSQAQLIALKQNSNAPYNRAIYVSAETGAGFDELEKALIVRLQDTQGQVDALVIGHKRHQDALFEALSALNKAQTLPDDELAAEELTIALLALGRIVGTHDIEGLLDIIFRDFCIGK